MKRGAAITRGKPVSCDADLMSECDAGTSCLVDKIRIYARERAPTRTHERTCVHTHTHTHTHTHIHTDSVSGRLGASVKYSVSCDPQHSLPATTRQEKDRIETKST